VVFSFFLSWGSKTQPNHWTKRDGEHLISHIGPKNPSRTEGMVANQLCRIVVCISSQIRLRCHRDMGDVQQTEKLFETSSVWWNLLVRIFVHILRDTSISEISESENGNRPALSTKRPVYLKIWQWYQNLDCKKLLDAKLFTQGKIASIVDQSWAPRTAKSARGVANILASGPGLGLSTKKKKQYFPFLLRYHPLPGPEDWNIT